MKPIQGYEGLYEITEDGSVWSLKSRKFLKPYESGNGYLKVKLTNGIENKQFFVHRLVAETFIPNPENLETVDHIDKNRRNNRMENLRWMSREENTRVGRGKVVYCVELDKTFPSQKAAAQELGIDQGNISKVCRGIMKQTSGYHFRYVEE